MISPGVCFIFFLKKLTFGGVLEVKGQKIAQNEK